MANNSVMAIKHTAADAWKIDEEEVLKPRRRLDQLMCADRANWMTNDYSLLNDVLLIARNNQMMSQGAHAATHERHICGKTGSKNGAKRQM